MKIDLITQKELAEIIGVDAGYISRLAKQGIFDNCRSGKKLIKDCALQVYFLRKQAKDNNIDFKPIETKTNITELNELLSQTESPTQYVQVLKDFWAGMIGKFKYEVEKGKYYSKEIIDKKAEHILVSFRNKTLAMPTKVAPTLVGIEDVAEIKSILDNAVYELLDELSRLEDITE